MQASWRVPPCQVSGLAYVLAAGAFVCTLFAEVFAIRECVNSAAPNAYVRRQGDDGYDFSVSRSLYPQPAPAWLVEVNNAEEVAVVVNCAAQADLKVCPRTGGHSFTGKGQCTGVMIDLIKLKSFSFDEGKNEITVGAGNTLGEMFLKTDQASSSSRVIGIGLCPSVGVAGYVLGGGHNPYSGLTGLTCESAVSFDFVLADGTQKTSTSASDPELFWASCGGGGGAFGILTSVTLRTAPAAKFNNNVYFRYKWPNSNAAEALHKYVDYDNEDGNVWIRLEMTLDGLVGYGACWESSSVENCEGRLGSAPFFNVAGRETLIAEKSSRVVDFQKFIGPAGSWASKIPTLSDSDALIGTQYDEASVGLKRMYTSGYWKFGNGKPNIQVYQQLVDIILSTDRSKVAWMLIQFNPWNGANKGNADTFAFPHRFQDAFTEFIGGKDDAQGSGIQQTLDELGRVQRAMLDTMKEWKSGIYVNYPEFGLGENEYGYLYWGSNLQRLSTLRASLDPTGLFAGKQQLSRGNLTCPGALSITGTGELKTILIEGYPFGQLGGMKTEMQVEDGCSLSNGDGAQLTRQGSGKYEAVVDGGAAFTVRLSNSSCDISVATINGISCSGDEVAVPQEDDEDAMPQEDDEDSEPQDDDEDSESQGEDDEEPLEYGDGFPCGGHEDAPSQGWSTMKTTGLPKPRHEATFVMGAGRKAYLLGGRRVQPVGIIDTVAASWTDASLPPEELHHFQAVYAEGLVWIPAAWTGGYPYEANAGSFHVYDPWTDTWSTRMPLAADRRRGSSAVAYHEGKLYVAMGNRGGHGAHASTLAWLDVYDIASDTWTSGPNAPDARDHTGGAIVGERFCIAGGRDGGTKDFFNKNIAATNCYNLAKGVWETAPDMPTPRAGSSYGTSCDGKLMVAGGEGAGQAYRRVDVFNGTSWEAPTFLAQARHGSGLAVAVDCSCANVYVASGSGAQGGSPELTSTEVFTPYGKKC